MAVNLNFTSSYRSTYMWSKPSQPLIFCLVDLIDMCTNLGDKSVIFKIIMMAEINEDAIHECCKLSIVFKPVAKQCGQQFNGTVGYMFIETTVDFHCQTSAQCYGQ